MKTKAFLATALTIALLLGTAFAALAANTMLTPARWNVNGAWLLTQSNGAQVALHLTQDGVGVRGTATRNGTGALKGTVVGTQQGNSIDLQITWDGGEIGVYSGVITRNGMKGTTHSQQKPSSRATWTIQQGVPLLTVATPAAPPASNSRAIKPNYET